MKLQFFGACIAAMWSMSSVNAKDVSFRLLTHDDKPIYSVAIRVHLDSLNYTDTPQHWWTWTNDEGYATVKLPDQLSDSDGPALIFVQIMPTLPYGQESRETRAQLTSRFWELFAEQALSVPLRLNIDDIADGTAAILRLPAPITVKFRPTRSGESLSSVLVRHAEGSTSLSGFPIAANADGYIRYAVPMNARSSLYISRESVTKRVVINPLDSLTDVDLGEINFAPPASHGSSIRMQFDHNTAPLPVVTIVSTDAAIIRTFIVDNSNGSVAVDLQQTDRSILSVPPGEYFVFRLSPHFIQTKEGDVAQAIEQIAAGEQPTLRHAVIEVVAQMSLGYRIASNTNLGTMTATRVE